MLNFSSLVPINIEEEMQRSYLDYAMSVIVSRALPDVRDGLKPVHRRILYAMHESGCDYNKPYRKSARIVGEVMGKYHPHGDAAIYDSLVRMAQDFSLRLPLIDGQGNFGSMDGDSAAAMRYTESRLDEAAHSLLENIDENTVNFQPNYDGSEKEPTVLPARYPNILVNGAGGIAVGMATNIPPHNLGEVIDGCCLYIENNEVTFEELCEVIKGPDFPTGGTIMGLNGIKSAFATGRGSVLIRGKTDIEETKEGKQAIIINEIPYQVNKARLVERIAELIKEKKIEGISDLRDESNKNGVRVVIELKRDVVADVLLNQLYSLTSLQTSFGVNMLALDQGRPELMNLKHIIRAFVEFREEVITKRTKFRLGKARDRAHLLLGLAVAVSNIDEVITLIKAAPDAQAAKEQLMERSWNADIVLPLLNIVEAKSIHITGNKLHLSELQAKAILEMRLQRLTGLEHQKIHDELEQIATDIKYYLHILDSREELLTLLKQELHEIKEKFATPRRTNIEASEFEQDIEDLIPREEMVVTITMGGYIKRVPLSTYRAQRRGGKGRAGVNMHEEDLTKELIVSSTHSHMLFFTSKGQVYRTKVYKLPIGTPQSKGRALVNIFPLAQDEYISSALVLPEDKNEVTGKSIIFATKSGNIRRNDIADFESIHAGGKIAIRLDDGDELIGVKLADEDNHVLLSTKAGKAIRFPIEALRIFKSRTSDGVRAIRLASNDGVISLSILRGVEVQDITARDNYLSINLNLRKQIADSENPQELIQQIDAEIVNSLTAEKIKYLADNEEFILTVTENGFGKRTSAYEYRITNRGGQGVTNIITSERNGLVVASFAVLDGDHIMMVTDKGKIIRCPVHDIRISGRNTQGVKLFTTKQHEIVVSVTKISDEGDKEEENEGEEGLETSNE
ncbi:DNA topoisomerase (ATP-hydrolyzing) subunit A [Rickettsiales endosymbiont of Stachyamoeba lipophora]|uniref:DNA topoisomerase (ATP-hydrolyzing) subunit A n=1 Tax=Rickettsiales endosymbiont of Stachyamoeba lipophora TaxID=2486578 RepID=UPI00397CFD89